MKLASYPAFPCLRFLSLHTVSDKNLRHGKAGYEATVKPVWTYDRKPILFVRGISAVSLAKKSVVNRYKYGEIFVVKFFHVLKRLGQFRFVYGFHHEGGTWWYIIIEAAFSVYLIDMFVMVLKVIGTVI